MVRFKHSTANELIDWGTAKQYSLQVMGTRLVWHSLEIDPETKEHDENSQASTSAAASAHIPTNEPNEPNEMEYAN